MCQDIASVLWKEWKIIFGKRESLRDKFSGAAIPLIVIFVLAVVPPLNVGADWFNSPFSLMDSLVFPLMIVITPIADAFAGERERHTLSTLLASRLPDRAILFGKMGAPAIYALGLTAVMHLVSLTVVNVANWNGTFRLYSPAIALANALIGFLLVGLAAGLGVLVSMHAATLQRAAQNLMTILMAPLLIVYVIIILIGTVLPEPWRADFEHFAQTVIFTADFRSVMLVIVAILLVADVSLLAAALARFKRAQLILD